MRKLLIPAIIAAAAVIYITQKTKSGPQLVRYEHAAQAAATKTGAKPAFKILFVGNSHTYVGDLPARVEALLNDDPSFSRTAFVGVVSFGGARLSRIINSGWASKALSATDWDLVVLQHQSTMALNENASRNFAHAVSWFMRRVDDQSKRVMIYQVWPHGPRSLARYRSYDSYPQSPAAMHRITSRAIDRVANKHGLRIANVGHCWLVADTRHRLYQADHNHASQLGAELSSRVLAKAIGDHINRIEGRPSVNNSPCPSPFSR